MYPFRLIPPVLLAALAGCASGEAMIASAPAAPAPEVVAPVDTAPPAPAVEPEIPLEERWRAPFAVQSVGQLAARDSRPAPVRLEEGAAPQSPAPGDTIQLDAVPVDSASPRPPEPAPRGEDTVTARPAAPPASGAAAPPGPSARSTKRTHEVKPGETFYGVARRYEVAPAALRTANPGVDPEKLRSGTTLWIPAAPAASSTPKPKESRSPAAGSRTAGTPKAGSSARRRTHKVVTGDTLFGIARRYDVSAGAIRAANEMKDDTVRLGQTLIIPGGT